MGKKSNKAASSTSDDLLSTLGDFTSKENWDKFFTIRGNDDSFEWYAEWPELRQPLISLLPPPSPPPQILVPGCGNSRLSEHLYDAGFTSITNVDFSKVVISDMLRRNVRTRPDMKWRVMDMTSMQFVDDSFDVVVDKGGLDALMEPELGPKLGDQYLYEAKRVLKFGGKFICLTLAESHVLGLLFPKFRLGWQVSVHVIPQKSSSKPSLQTFMVISEKETSFALQPIKLLFDHSSLGRNNSQAVGVYEAVEKENQLRQGYLNGSDVVYSLEDLKLGAKSILAKLSKDRRSELTLGGEGSRFSYRAVLLDAQEDSGPFTYNCGVFLVPKTRAREWLFSSEEGQWLVVESSKAARLIMVLLDSSHDNVSMDDIQKDLSPLVKELAPTDDNGSQIPFMMASDGIKQLKSIHSVTSSLTGPITVDDVTYENSDPDVCRLWPSEELQFRRLVFRRTQALVQSEALLLKGVSSHKTVDETDKNKVSSSFKSKKRGNLKRKDDSINKLKVYHGYLASSYHMGIISGFILNYSHLESIISSGQRVKAIVIGLGAGLLPMFLRGCMPFLDTEVVELDPILPKIAKNFFGFIEDEQLKVHVADGIQFVRDIRNSLADANVSGGDQNNNDSSNTKHPLNGNHNASHAETRNFTRVDILVIDVDSSDSSSGMTCPAADFVEESFLLAVREILSAQGLFIVNLVSRSQAIKDMVVSRMKAVFNHLYGLQLEEDVNLVLFGLCSESCIKDDFPKAAIELEKLLKVDRPEISQIILDGTKKIRYLK